MFEDDPQTQVECEQLVKVLGAISSASRNEANVSPDLLFCLTTERFRRILPLAGIPKKHWKAVATMVIVLCFLDDDALDRAAAGSGAAPFIFALCQRANAIHAQYPEDSPRGTETSTTDVLAIRRHIDALHTIDREIIRRRLWHSEPLAVIAADLNLRFAIVASTVFRFLASIRRYLEE